MLKQIQLNGLADCEHKKQNFSIHQQYVSIFIRIFRYEKALPEFLHLPFVWFSQSKVNWAWFHNTFLFHPIPLFSIEIKSLFFILTNEFVNREKKRKDVKSWVVWVDVVGGRMERKKIWIWKALCKYCWLRKGFLMSSRAAGKLLIVPWDEKCSGRSRS